MTITAAIKFTQGSTTDSPGNAVIGSTSGGPVVCSNGDNTGIVTFVWTMIDVPPGSAVALGTFSTSSTGTFAQPDLPGGYLVQLTVSDGTTTVTSILDFQILEASGRMIPPFKASDLALTFGGQTRGWSPTMEAWLHYVDSLKTVHNVRAATTGALPAHTVSGNVMTASANGALPSQDGVALAVGDPLLVKDEGSGSSVQNGKWIVSSLGSVSSLWTLTRASDFNTNFSVKAGYFGVVEEGTVNGKRGFTLTTPNPIVLGTTALSFKTFAFNSLTPPATPAQDNFAVRASGGDLQYFNGAAGQVSIWTGTTVQFGAVSLASGSAGITGTLGIANGGTGLNAVGSVNTVPISNGTAIAYGLLVDANVSGTAAIAVTKLALGAANRVLLSDGTSNQFGQISDAFVASGAAIAVSKLAVGSANTVLTSNGTVDSFAQVTNAFVAPSAAIAVTKLALGGANTVLLSDGTSNQFGSITDAYINTTAAIQVSKLGQGGATLGQALIWSGSVWAPSTNFGAQNLVTTGSISIGATPGSVGDLRVKHGFSWKGRNSSNTTDYSVLDFGITTTDVLTIGDAVSSSVVVIQGNSVGGIWIAPGGTQRLSINAASVFISTPLLQFSNSQTNPLFNHQDATGSGVTGNPLTIQAQKSTGTGATVGGKLVLASGTGATAGAVQIQAGSTTVAQLAKASGDFVQLGVTPAGTGVLRLSYGDAAKWRNFGNSADLTVYQTGIGTSGNNNINFGDTGTTTTVLQGGSITLNIGSTIRAALSATQLTMSFANLTFSNSNLASAPMITQLAESTLPTAAAMTIQAQGNSVNAGTAGALNLLAGDESGTGATVGGALLLRSGNGATVGNVSLSAGTSLNLIDYGVTTASTLTIGNGTVNTVNYNVNGLGTGHIFQMNGGNVFAITSSSITTARTNFQFTTGSSSIQIADTLATTGTFASITIKAQGGGGLTGNYTAGSSVIQGGDVSVGTSGTHTGGDVLLRGGQGGATANNGNISLGSVAPVWNGGAGILFVSNAFALPTANPTGGGYLYVDTGALKYRGSSGTITMIAAA